MPVPKLQQVSDLSRSRGVQVRWPCRQDMLPPRQLLEKRCRACGCVITNRACSTLRGSRNHMGWVVTGKRQSSAELNCPGLSSDAVFLVTAAYIAGGEDG